MLYYNLTIYMVIMMNNIIRCAGANTNNLQAIAFQNLFKQECLKEGNVIVSFQMLGNYIILAEVLKQE